MLATFSRTSTSSLHAAFLDMGLKGSKWTYNIASVFMELCYVLLQAPVLLSSSGLLEH
jgi:hypothetical protein